MDEPLDQQTPETESTIGRLVGKHRLPVMLGSVIVASLILVGVAMSLYGSSGAALLDLSLPGAQSARDQVNEAQTASDFPATGAVTDQTVKQFRSLYEKQAHQATGLDAFGGAPVSYEALDLAPPTQ